MNNTVLALLLLVSGSVYIIQYVDVPKTSEKPIVNEIENSVSTTPKETVETPVNSDAIVYKEELLPTSANDLFAEFTQGAKPVDVKPIDNSERINVNPSNELFMIATLLFKNECGNDKDNLVFWNPKENFPSLGIGHFLWMKDHTGQFVEFIKYLETINTPGIPEILLTGSFPWKSRNEFMSAKSSGQLNILEDFLYRPDVMEAQAHFIQKQFTVKMIGESIKNRNTIKDKIDRIASAPLGWYLLLDYANFKGTSEKVIDTYQVSWGLVTVLDEMKDTGNVYQDFYNAALNVLQRRVNNAPAGSRDESFMTGWEKRISSYKNPKSAFELAQQ